MSNPYYDIVIQNGYKKHGYGYKKVIGSTCHWVSLYDTQLQMYAYDQDDVDLEKVYDTGPLTVSQEDFKSLIRILTTNTSNLEQAG